MCTKLVSQDSCSMTKKEQVMIQDFWMHHDIVMKLPYKRYQKWFYMHSAMKPAYEQYCHEQEALGNRVLSLSSILRAILKTVKCMKHVPYCHCQCSKCLNGGLLLSAVKAANVKGLIGSMMQAALLNMCPPEGNITNMMIGDCRCECIFRE